MLNVNNEYNVLSKKFNPTKRAKHKNSHSSLVLHGCMDTCRGKEKFINFRILLDSGRTSTIAMNNLTPKLKRKKSSTTMWQTQGGNFTTNEMATVDFCLSELNATKIVTRKFHVKDSTEIRYNIFLGIDLITALVLDLKFSGNILVGGDGPHEGCLAPMADVTGATLNL